MQLPIISARRIAVASLLAAQVCAESITLTMFQQISGFPSACTAAYTAPIEGCTKNDFINGNPCSQACVKGLEKITDQLNTACAGISTSPSTLIGLFFQKKGIPSLCPKIASGSTAASSSTDTPSSAVPSSTTSSEDSEETSSTTSTSISSSTSSTTTDSPQTSTSSSPVQTSINIIMTSPSSATATPNSNFGGDVGDLNGRPNSASNLHTNVFSMSLVIAGMMMGTLV